MAFRSAYLRLLVAVVRLVIARPWWVLSLVMMSVVGSAIYTVQNFRFNSDTSQLVHQDAPFRRNYRAFNRIFSHYDRTTLIVVTAANHRRASDAAKRLRLEGDIREAASRIAQELGPGESK